MLKTTKSKLVAAVAASAAFSSQASAAITAPTFAADDAITVGTAVLTGIALIWAIRKAMSIPGR